MDALTHPTPRQVVLILGGGGALGAFACGVWQVLGYRLARAGARLCGVSGSSIGAINASFIARHHDDPDMGAAVLSRQWREHLTTPAYPFVGWSLHPSLRSWNGLFTGLLMGNQSLHRTEHSHWNPLAGLNRLAWPLADRTRMRRWLHDQHTPYRSRSTREPLLGAVAVDIASGDLRLFHSDDDDIRTEHLMASSAIPVLYEPITIDDRLYWDGDITRESATARFLEALQDSGRLDPDEPTVLITVDQMPRQPAAVPAAGIEIIHRMLEILQQGKVRDGAQDLPAGMHALHIVRESLPDDNVSGQFDYSPQRIEALMAHGRQQAIKAWDAWPRAITEGQLVVGCSA